jgi:hypothetical protein
MNSVKLEILMVSLLNQAGVPLSAPISKSLSRLQSYSIDVGIKSITTSVVVFLWLPWPRRTILLYQNAEKALAVLLRVPTSLKSDLLVTLLGALGLR